LFSIFFVSLIWVLATLIRWFEAGGSAAASIRAGTAAATAMFLARPFQTTKSVRVLTSRYRAKSSDLRFSGTTKEIRQAVPEVAGEALGGYVGGMCPDLLEPAISSWHRGPARSYAAGGGIVAIRKGLEAFAAVCRENAEKCKAIDMIQSGSVFVPAIPDPLSLLLSPVFELLWRLMAGFVSGFAAGYVSHLALDGIIGKRSIPILTNGF
jgi:hypothetical protein